MKRFIWRAEKTVNRNLLVVKDLAYGFQFCCPRQFDMRRFDTKDWISPCLPPLRQSKSESAKAGRVELSRIRKIQCHTESDIKLL